MLRKLAAAIAIAGSVTGTIGASTAYGLGLGDIRLNSALNQPLDAEIELVEIRELTRGEVLPSMATREDFERAGVERPYFLSDLRFQTIKREDGTAFVRVTSRKPVVEPYLNFLMEVHWPSGRLLREYTLLLDPPSFSNQVVESAVSTNPVQVPPPAPAPATPVKRPNISAPSPVSTPVQAPASPSPSVPAQDDASDTYRVQRGDTLWEVALRTRPGRDVTPIQMMAALQAENPRAFINGNINLLKQGAVLNVPDRDAINALDGNAAANNIRAQNEQWRNGSSRVQLDATRKDEVVETARGTIEQDRLDIVTSGAQRSADNASDQGGGDAAGTARALETAISVNQEQLDTLSRENTDLKDRLRDLEDQIQSLEKLVVLKSDELTAVQMLNEQVQAAQAKVEAAEAEQDIDYNYYEADEMEPVQEPSAPSTATIARPDDSITQAPVAPVSDFSPETEPKPDLMSVEGVMNLLMKNQMYLAAGGGSLLVLLAIAALVVRRRRQKEEEDSIDTESTIAPADELEDLPDVEDLFVAQDTAKDDELDSGDVSQAESDETPDLDINEELLSDTTSAQEASTDPLGEADIYIAYGRLDQAVELLATAVAGSPERADFRIKLMEVMTDSKNVEGFLEQEEALQNLGSSEGIKRASELRPRFPAGTFDAAADITDETSQSEELQAKEPTKEDTGSVDELEIDFGDENLDTGLEFNLDDFETDTASEDTPPDSAEDETNLESAADEFDLDLETLDAEVDESETSAEPVTQEVETLDTPEAELPDLDDLDLELSTDLDTSDVEELTITQDNAAEDITVEEATVEEATAADHAPLTEETSDVDFDSELEQLDAELADMSVDLDLDGADIEEALTPESMPSNAEETTDELAVEGEPAPSIDAGEPVEAAEKSTANAVTEQLDAALAGLSETNTSGDVSQMEDEFSFLEDTDETATKLDLARAYLEMGDGDGARDILDEVVLEGNDAQKQEAQELIAKIGK
ncbi:FimV/HubP family polar landmark protein [Sansalvadorimonas verongulae]|uniref:FimV/HubP family polar landmark protein n=1 Tax=Sansalvadorimonas verongulae TaxID=2172824 RepID=UPI0012BC95BD|nr:FimV/HubP family polar landmark protein [Sansalvadorimonas verongulae]MTI12936.1 hypothetical protein [Sansalvadorimonas verongulae]